MKTGSFLSSSSLLSLFIQASPSLLPVSVSYDHLLMLIFSLSHLWFKSSNLSTCTQAYKSHFRMKMSGYSNSLKLSFWSRSKRHSHSSMFQVIIDESCLHSLRRLPVFSNKEPVGILRIPYQYDNVRII